MSRQFFIHQEEEMHCIASWLAPLLQRGDVLTLHGDLGAGKTAFARALIQQMSVVPEEVPSPTFTLVQVYEALQPPIWHFDLYRLEEEEKDILELGWEEARRFGISVVEWPQRLGSLLPKDRLDIYIRFVAGDETARQIECIPAGAWLSRLGLEKKEGT